MSQLTSKPIGINLKTGFDWFGVVRIGTQPRTSASVLYQLSATSPRFRVSLEAANDAGIRLSFTGSDGVPHQSKPIGTRAYLDQWCILNWSIIANKRGVNIHIRLVEGPTFTQDFKCPKHFPAEVDQSIGAATDGSAPASFSLAELLIFDKILETPQQRELEIYLKSKFGADHV